MLRPGLGIRAGVFDPPAVFGRVLFSPAPVASGLPSARVSVETPPPSVPAPVTPLSSPPSEAATWLSALWSTPAGPRGARGAPPKSGSQIIRDKSAVILAKTNVQPNPVAVALGLGPCRIAAVDPKRTNDRPSEKLTAAVGHQARTGHYVASYHITWVAQYGTVPDIRGREYSHLCHTPCCVAPTHGVWENNKDNKARNSCRDGKSHYLFDNGPNDRHLLRLCSHEPPCLSGTEVFNWQHPSVDNSI